MTSFKIILLLILQIHYSVGNRGHFVNLLQFPALFCAPWNPSKSSLILIQHQKIEFSVHDIYYLDNTRGRLKDDISCWMESDQNGTEWCQLFSDTGYVQCDRKGRRKDFPTDDRNEKFRYGSNTVDQILLIHGIFCIILFIYLYNELHQVWMLVS